MRNEKTIIFVVPSFTVFGVKGYEKVVLQWANFLSDHYSVHIVNLGGQKNNSEFNSDLGIMIHERSVSKFIQLFNAALALLKLRPLQTELLFSKSNNNYLSEMQSQYSVYANIFVTIRTHHFATYQNIPKDIILAVDSMTLNFLGKLKHTKGLRRLLYLIEYWLLCRHEKNILSEYKRAVFVSHRDALMFKNLRTQVVPLATHIPDMKVARRDDTIKILFTGNMSYEPNRTAVTWFYNQVFNKLKINECKLKFVVCGRFANDWAYLDKHPDIQVKSDVPNIFDEIFDCDIYVAPMQSGSGMQFKIIEAMACGKPVITTTLGLGSISINDNWKDIVIVDTPDEFCKAVTKLCGSAEIRDSLGNEARATIIEKYSESVINRQVISLIND